MPRYGNRLFLVVMAARQPAVNAWFVGNVDRQGGDRTFSLGLSPTGTTPATHYVCNGSWTEGELARIVDFLGPTVPRPANWNGMAQAARKSWIAASFPPTIRCEYSDTNDTWPSLEAVLASMGLKRIE